MLKSGGGRASSPTPRSPRLLCDAAPWCPEEESVGDSNARRHGGKAWHAACGPAFKASSKRPTRSQIASALLSFERSRVYLACCKGTQWLRCGPLVDAAVEAQSRTSPCKTPVHHLKQVVHCYPNISANWHSRIQSLVTKLEEALRPTSKTLAYPIPTVLETSARPGAMS